jgi:hypothetical protein
MELLLKREIFTDKSTIGSLFVDGTFQCFTLEPVVRKEKIFGQTAIPYGIYDITITCSAHFGCDLPLLNNVPNFEGVRIHPGNTAADTEGCILVGTIRVTDDLISSRSAFNLLFPKIKAALDSGDKVTIDIR